VLLDRVPNMAVNCLGHSRCDSVRSSDSEGTDDQCAKGQVRQLKTALRWKIPPEQRQRIQMRVAEHGEPVTGFLPQALANPMANATRD
jgi:hypothetical protein